MKHFLLSVDGSNNSLQSASFINSFFANKDDLHVTLFHVAPPNPYTHKYLTAAWEQDYESENCEAAISPPVKSTMWSLKKHLQQSGIAETNLTQKVVSKKTTVVDDIIDTTHDGMYDSLVLGRRTSSFVEDCMVESVSRQMLKRNIGFPLWVCRQPEDERKDVLLCTDGSESCMRLADHVGYMLHGEENHSVTLLHVDNGVGPQIDKNKAFELTASTLVQNGLSENNIQTKIVRSKAIAHGIKQELSEEKYATVAIGCDAHTNRGLGDWLLKDLKKTSLWVVK